MARIDGANFNASIATFDADSSNARRYFLDTDTATGTQATNTGGFGWNASTFTDSAFHLVVARITQDSSATINLTDGNIVYTSGHTAFLANQSTFRGSSTTVTLNWDRVNLFCTNSFTNGFGSTGNEGFISGNIQNCLFQGIGTSVWFINLQKASGTFGFSNNRFIQSALNTPRVGTPFRGLDFDGTTRDDRGHYTMRIQGQNRTNHSIQAHHIFRSGDYAATEGADTNQIGNGVHYQIFTFNGDLWSINNQYEDDNMVFGLGSGHSGTGVTARECFMWRPQFFQTGSDDTISDIRLIGLPDDMYSMGANARVENGFEAIGTTQTTLSSTGYLVQTDSENYTFVNNARHLTKALDFGRTDGRLTLAGTAPTCRAKSYTHMAESVTMEVNEFDYPGGLTGVWDFSVENSAHVNFYPADPNLNGRAVDANETAQNAAISNLDDIYPLYKRLWYEDDALDVDFPLTVSGGQYVFALAPSLYNAGPGVDSGNTLNVTGQLSIENTTSVTDVNVNTVRGMFFDNDDDNVFRRVNITGNSLTLRTRAHDASIAGNRNVDISGLTAVASGNELGAPITLDGNFIEVGILDDDVFDNLTVADNARITLESVTSDTTVLLEDKWGSVIWGDNILLTQSGGGILTIQTNAFTQSDLATGSTGVNVVPIPINPTAVTFRADLLPSTDAGLSMVAGQLRHNGGIAFEIHLGDPVPSAGVTYTNANLDARDSNGNAITATLETTPLHWITTSRDSRLLITGVQAAANTTLTDSSGNRTLIPALGAALRDIPPSSMGGLSVSLGGALQNINGAPRLQIIADNNNLYTGTGVLDIAGATGHLADTRATIPYLNRIWEMIAGDANLTLPTVGTLSFDVFLPSAEGVDFRRNRCHFSDPGGGAGTETNGVQVIPGARMVNDSDEFSTVGISLLNQIRPESVEAGSGNEPQVIFYPRFAERTIVEEPSTDDISRALRTTLDNRGVTRGNMTNIGLNVPILSPNGTAFATTPDLPTTGGGTIPPEEPPAGGDG